MTKEREEWKKKKMEKKQAEWEEQKKKAKGKGGKAPALSGRALFHINADLFKDDDAAFDDREYDAVSDDDSDDDNNNKDAAAAIGSTARWTTRCFSVKAKTTSTTRRSRRGLGIHIYLVNVRDNPFLYYFFMLFIYLLTPATTPKHFY